MSCSSAVGVAELEGHPASASICILYILAHTSTPNPKPLPCYLGILAFTLKFNFTPPKPPKFPEPILCPGPLVKPNTVLFGSDLPEEPFGLTTLFVVLHGLKSLEALVSLLTSPNNPYYCSLQNRNPSPRPAPQTYVPEPP